MTKVIVVHQESWDLDLPQEEIDRLNASGEEGWYEYAYARGLRKPDHDSLWVNVKE